MQGRSRNRSLGPYRLERCDLARANTITVGKVEMDGEARICHSPVWLPLGEEKANACHGQCMPGRGLRSPAQAKARADWGSCKDGDSAEPSVRGGTCPANIRLTNWGQPPPSKRSTASRQLVCRRPGLLKAVVGSHRSAASATSIPARSRSHYCSSEALAHCRSAADASRPKSRRSAPPPRLRRHPGSKARSSGPGSSLRGAAPPRAFNGLPNAICRRKSKAATGVEERAMSCARSRCGSQGILICENRFLRCRMRPTRRLAGIFNASPILSITSNG